MGRRAKPPKGQAEAKRALVRKSPKADALRVQELETRLAEALEQLHTRNRELVEALDRETATSEILRVISSGPTDTQPVFDGILDNATRLLKAENGILYLYDGEAFQVVACRGLSSEAEAHYRARAPRPGARSGLGRMLAEKRPVQVADITDDDAYRQGDPLRVRTVKLLGARTAVWLPLLNGSETVVGALGIYRHEVRPFTDKQIGLVATFADQAVIAIENVRHFNETKEALEQQTATSEILRVISSSPTDVRPVFDAVAESAARLCEAQDASIFRREGDRLAFVAHHGPIAQRHGDFSLPLVRGTVGGRSVLESRTVQVADLQNEDREFPDAVENARRFGFRTILSVPLLREGIAIGGIQLRRTEVQLFSDRQIALLQTFTDQAIIAIENVRLFKALEEKNRALSESNAQITQALERQTATADVLRIIAQSPTELQPVLDAIAASAVRLCAATDVVIERLEGDRFYNAAHAGSQMKGLVGLPLPLTRRFPGGRAVLDRTAIIIDDIHLVAEREYPDTLELLKLNTIHSVAEIPLLSEDKPLGSIAVLRAEVRPFTPGEIALLRTFADQAVIAIENVRLFKELEARNRDLTEALEQQTATAEILRVISSSPADLEPVFRTLLVNAARLCGAHNGGIFRVERGALHLAASYNISPELRAHLESAPIQPGPGGALRRAALELQPVQSPDASADTDLPVAALEAYRREGMRTAIAVPLLKENTLIGAIAFHRREVRPFSDKQIALLKSFADQAVIAIENVRLFTELQEKNRALSETLEQQTATSEILRVISSSPTDVQPVFDSIVQSAARLCHAANAGVFLTDGRTLDLPANYGSSSPEALATIRAQYPRPVDQETTAGVAILTRSVIHVPDIEAPSAAEVYTRRVGRLLGVRSMVAVPMMRKGEVVGAINLSRQEPGRFSDMEVELLKTFADQAVIAIENVRLFTELQASNRDLTKALDKQTATSDILRVISQSQTDVQPVFDAIVSSAVRLLRAYTGTLTRIAGDQIELAALTSTDEIADATTRALFPRSLHTEGLHVRAIRDRAPFNVVDFETDPRWSEVLRARTRARGYRSWAVVPLLQHDAVIGTIAVTRREPGGFTDDEIALLQTFADQAVIAIENARLLTELQARTQELSRSVEQLTALGEVGRAVSSTLDLETVLTTIVSRAVELSGLDGGIVSEYEEATDEFVQRAASQAVSALAMTLRGTRYRRGEGAIGRTAITRQPVQVPDITVPGAYDSRARANLIESGVRAVLAVPMIHQDRLIGCLGVTRNRPGDFPSETIQMLQTFATQSALAIQNARLFQELADKSRQLEAASQHKSEFLANMSHELRTPLNAIIGFSEVLTERMFGELNEKQAEYLKDIYASGTHLLSLINDILDLSKIEAGRMELELTDFDLPQAIDNALILVRERAGRRGIALEHSVAERLGEIRGDERKIKQVLLNLLSNALKFTPESGRVEVRARVVDGMAEISVTDTGVGIAPEDQEAVFEEFRQVGTSAAKQEGTGLGLALCRKFVELHGGKIGVTSQVGVGSTFTFTIPVR